MEGEFKMEDISKIDDNVEVDNNSITQQLDYVAV